MVNFEHMLSNIENDIEIISLPGDLPDIFVVHRSSGLAIRVQDQVTTQAAEFVGKNRLAVCVAVMQQFAGSLPDELITPRN